MGQKVNPIGYRLQLNKKWDSKWVVNNSQLNRKKLHFDLKARKYLEKIFLKKGFILVNCFIDYNLSKILISALIFNKNFFLKLNQRDINNFN